MTEGEHRIVSVEIPFALYRRLEALAEQDMQTVELAASRLLREAIEAQEREEDTQHLRPEHRALERLRDRFATGMTSATLREVATEAHGYLEHADLPEDLRLSYEWLEVSSLTWADRLEGQGR